MSKAEYSHGDMSRLAKFEPYLERWRIAPGRLAVRLWFGGIVMFCTLSGVVALTCLRHRFAYDPSSGRLSDFAMVAFAGLFAVSSLATGGLLLESASRSLYRRLVAEQEAAESREIMKLYRRKCGEFHREVSQIDDDRVREVAVRFQELQFQD